MDDILLGLITCCALLGAWLATALPAMAGSTTRPAGRAGTWYPGEAGELGSFVDKVLARTPDVPARIEGKPLAVIAPHAGYRYSGDVAGAGFRCLRGHRYKRVFVLAFSHQHAHTYRGIDIPGQYQAYQTPLGDLTIDREVIDALGSNPLFAPHAGVDVGEHSLELQLPFLQRAIGDFRLVPLLVGKMNIRDYAEVGKVLLPWLDDETLLVVSSDCTHFGPNYGYEPFSADVPKRLRELADQASDAIEACNFDLFAEHLEDTRDTICGRDPILLLLRTLSMRGGATGMRTAFDTSGRMTGDYSNSVTYQSFVFVPRQGSLSTREREMLLRLARETVATALADRPPPSALPPDVPATLSDLTGACFVTLHNHGRLRGCIGNMEACGPLWQAVVHNAVSSATQDYRFANNPVTSGELADINIEISYLTPMKPVKNTREVVIGRHGLLIELDQQRGVLLPQVAYERGWLRDEFLAQVCLKAGLSMDAWKDPKARLFTFEAEVFGEPEPDASSGKPQ